MKRRKNAHSSCGKIVSAKDRPAWETRMLRNFERTFNAFLDTQPILKKKIMAGLPGHSEEQE